MMPILATLAFLAFATGVLLVVGEDLAWARRSPWAARLGWPALRRRAPADGAGAGLRVPGRGRTVLTRFVVVPGGLCLFRPAGEAGVRNYWIGTLCVRDGVWEATCRVSTGVTLTVASWLPTMTGLGVYAKWHGATGVGLTAFIMLVVNLALLVSVARRQYRLFLACELTLRNTLDG